MVFFFFNDTATTEIYTLSLHDALPIFRGPRARGLPLDRQGQGQPHRPRYPPGGRHDGPWRQRSEEHTSELQSRQYLVCRLLLEKKKHNRFCTAYSSINYCTVRYVAHLY